MRIALVAPGFSRDADDWAIPALQHLACHLAQQHELHVFSLRYPSAGLFTFCKLTHHATGGGTRSGPRALTVMARTVRAIVAEHRRAPFDLLHAFWIDEAALVAALAGGVVRRPVLASIGGGELVHLPAIDYGTWASRWRRRLIRLAVGRAQLVTAGSSYARQLALARGFPPAKVMVVPLGVDTEQFQPSVPPHAGRPTLVQAASLVPVKNQALLLDVVARAQAHLPGIRLRIAGAGPQAPALRAEAARLGMENVITWEGAVAYTDMAAFYGQGHLYLHSSLYESQGMAVLEAMACGLPVLGSPVGIVPEVAAAPPSDDAGVLARQVVTLLGNPTLLASAQQKALALVRQRFTLATATVAFNRLYHQLL